MSKNIEKYIDLHKRGKVSDTTIIKMASFKEELEKLSNMNPALNLTKNTLLAGLTLGPALALGSYVTGKVINNIESGFENRRGPSYFENMLKHKPELNEYDHDLLIKYFQSLMHFAPNVAQDPVAAAAYIKQAIQYDESAGGPPFSAIDSLTKVEKAMRDNKPELNSVGAKMMNQSVAYNPIGQTLGGEFLNSLS